MSIKRSIARRKKPAADVKVPTLPLIKYKEAVEQGKPLVLTYAEETELRRSLRDMEEGAKSSDPRLQMINDSMIRIIRAVLEKWEEDKPHHKPHA